MLRAKLDQPLKALWIEKSALASRKAKRSLISASDEAHVVSGCETTPALHRAQLCSSREDKGKAPKGAISEATATKFLAARLELKHHLVPTAKLFCLKEKHC